MPSLLPEGTASTRKRVSIVPLSPLVLFGLRDLLVTPFNYTAWGYRDCQRDPTNPGFGSAIGPLLLRCLPYHYPENSVYTWYGPPQEILNGIC